ncbi:hypothetical protein SRCM100169_03786 [Bacillus siamensis]|nr:hypothetical protein SRCM100169_03786 [Bacillus siamensis]
MSQRLEVPVLPKITFNVYLYYGFVLQVGYL